MLLRSRHNTDYAAQLKTQYRLCCSAQNTFLNMLVSSEHNTDYAAQLYVQYRLCSTTPCSIPSIWYSALCSIPTMLLLSKQNTDYTISSMLNTDYAAQLYAQYRLFCLALCSHRLCRSSLCSIPTLLLSSMLNTNYAAQLYAQYWLCCSALSTIQTMLLSSMLNTN